MEAVHRNSALAKLRRVIKRPLRWVLVIALLILGAGGAWVGREVVRARRPAEIRPELLFPNNISAAIRVSDFEGAFDRHWLARGKDDSDEAIEQLLRALGVWDLWLEEYGQRSARSRIKAYKTALFRLMGTEGWVVFGEWAPPGLEGTGEVALLLFLRADSPYTARIGPLANLLFPGHKIQKTEYRAVEIYEYLDAQDRRAITLANIGGWICASMRSTGREPVVRMIDQYHEARRTGTESAPLFAHGSEGPPPVTEGALYPPRLWAQLRQFALKRGKPLTVERENEIFSWAHRLESIEEISVRQTGKSLLNLDLTLRGPRVRNLHEVLIDTTKVPLDPLDAITTSSLELGPAILQADFTYPFATEGLTLFGVDWEDLVEDLEDLKWINSRLAKNLESIFENDEPPADGRFGIAFFANGRSAIPGVGLWEDRAPVAFGAASPADAWRAIGERRASERGDSAFAAGTNSDDAPTTTGVKLREAQRKLANDLWSASGTPPVAYLLLHFDELRPWMDNFPLIFLSSDDRVRWIKYRAYAQGFQLGIGSVALRLDRTGDEMTLRMRTLELN